MRLFGVVFLLATLACDSNADTVRFRNLSNDDVKIAVRYVGTKNGVGIAGWTTLRPGQQKDYQNNGSLFFRVEHRRREYTWESSQRFERFPVSNAPFRISPTDNPDIKSFRWGVDLQNRRYWRTGTPYPEGFMKVQFFKGIHGNRYNISP